MIEKILERLEVLHDLVKDNQKLAVSQAIKIVQEVAKEYEGRVIELPCKAGDTVYRFCGAKGRKYVDIRYVNNITYRLDYKGDVVWEIFTTTTDVLGKTVFLTRSEAEEALAKMGGK